MAARAALAAEKREYIRLYNCVYIYIYLISQYTIPSPDEHRPPQFLRGGKVGFTSVHIVVSTLEGKRDRFRLRSKRIVVFQRQNCLCRRPLSSATSTTQHGQLRCGAPFQTLRAPRCTAMRRSFRRSAPPRARPCRPSAPTRWSSKTPRHPGSPTPGGRAVDGFDEAWRQRPAQGK